MSRKKQKNKGKQAVGGTRIALILDRSGSMSAIQDEAREAFNEAVDRVRDEARKTSGDVSLSLLMFNQEVQDVLVNEPARRVRRLRSDDYQPGGMTALFDAVGRGIDLLEKPGPLGEEDAALVIVITDGHENASRKITQPDLVERMQALETTDQWTFTFMCANVDIRDLAAQLQVPAGNMRAWSHAAPRDMPFAANYALSDYMEDRRAGKRSKKNYHETPDQERFERMRREYLRKRAQRQHDPHGR